MAVLRAIGRFFARIGRWIRDTAWVQPLLIVGGIFAIIFSIPYITTWVKSWFEEGDAALAYYKKNKVSWKGIEKDGRVSEIDKLFSYLEDPDAAENAAAAKKYGRKFFINFVQEGCEGCASNYEGFKDLTNKWNKYFVPQNGESLKVFNIFIEETNSDDELLFTKYVSGDKSTCRYNDFFDEAANLKNPYMNNVDGGGDNYYSKLAANDNSFDSPTTILIDMDFSNSHYELGQYGVTEIFYTINGKDGKDSSFAKAEEIFDCWNHEGDFAFRGTK